MPGRKRRTKPHRFRLVAAVAALGLFFILASLIAHHRSHKPEETRRPPDAARSAPENGAQSAGPAVGPSPTAASSTSSAIPKPAGSAPIAPPPASPDTREIARNENPASVSPPESVDSLIRRAKEEWSAHPALARDILEKAVERDPSNPDAMLQLGRLLTVTKDYPGAIRQYQNALRLDSRISEAYFNLGYIFLLQGENRLAVSNYESCVALAPPYQDEALTNLGVAYRRMGSLAAAKNYFKKALDLNPVNKLALHNLMSAASEEHRNGSRTGLGSNAINQ
jgi:tetratricopeptide (TPR) repeat protein